MTPEEFIEMYGHYLRQVEKIHRKNSDENLIYNAPMDIFTKQTTVLISHLEKELAEAFHLYFERSEDISWLEL